MSTEDREEQIIQVGSRNIQSLLEFLPQAVDGLSDDKLQEYKEIFSFFDRFLFSFVY